jgi:hypothetical protein
MLQIIIHHEGNNGSEVTIAGILNKVSEDNVEILAAFDEEKGNIDVDVCIPYIGQDIEVKHIYPEEEECYQAIANLEAVDTDKDGIKYIRFTPKERHPLIRG